MATGNNSHSGAARRLRQLLGALALVATVMLGMSSDAYAQSKGTKPTPVEHAKPTKGSKPVSGKVDVEVLIVHATNSGQVDPRLENLQRQLKFTRYSGFELLSTHPAALAEGQESSVNVVGGRKLRVRLIEHDDESAKVRIRLSKNNENVLDTTVRIHRNRVFTVAGPKYQDGVLIFPVSVSY